MATIEYLLLMALPVVLIAGGVVLMLSARRIRAEEVAKRVQLIIAPLGGGEVTEETQAGPRAPLVRSPTGKMSQAQLREIARVLRPLRIPARYAPAAYGWLRILLAVVLPILGFVAVRLALRQPSPLTLIFTPIALVAVGWFVPALILNILTRRHITSAAEGLPEALELMVVCVEAGLSLEDSIDRITGEMKWSRPALADELALTSADLKILPDRDQALGNLAARVDTPSVRSVVTSLSQTLKYGTPLAQALRNTAAELRNDALLDMEERGNRLPSLLTIPMMLFIMPTIFLIIGGPAALRLMDTFAK